MDKFEVDMLKSRDKLTGHVCTNEFPYLLVISYNQ